MSKDFYTLNYRRNQLENELDKIREIVSGREASFLPRITDGEGKRDLKMVESLIDSMIDNYNEYRKEWGSAHGGNQEPVEGEARRFFHHLLYLGILGPGGESFQDTYTYFSNFIIRKSEKYSDILKNAKRLEYFRDRGEMYRAEAYFNEYYYEENTGWTNILNDVFWEIMGYGIKETYTLSPEEWDPNNMWERWRPSVKAEESGEGPAEESSGEENTGAEESCEGNTGADNSAEESSGEENSGAEGSAEGENSGEGGGSRESAENYIFKVWSNIKSRPMTEEEKAFEEFLEQNSIHDEYEYDDQAPPPTDYDEWLEREEEEKERIREENEEARRYFKSWLDTVPDAEAFCALYLEFRELMVTPELAQIAKNAAKEIEMLLDAWLYCTGESPYTLGNTYGLVANRIDNTVAHLRKEIDRARRLS